MYRPRMVGPGTHVCKGFVRALYTRRRRGSPLNWREGAVGGRGGEGGKGEVNEDA